MNKNYESSTDFLLVNQKDDTLTITLNRPEALNAFRPEMLVSIRETVMRVEEDHDISVIIIDGAGKAFSAGVDLKVLQGFNPSAGKIGDLFDKPAALASVSYTHLTLPTT